MILNLKLKGRMLLGYAVPVIIYVGLATLVYSTANQVVTTFQEVKRVQNVLDGVYKLDTDAQTMVRSARGYLVLENADLIQEYQTSLQEINNVVKAIEPHIIDPEQKQRLQRLAELIIAYDQGRDGEIGSREMIQMYQQGRRKQAIDLIRQGKMTKYVEEFDKTVDQMLAFERSMLDQQTSRAEAAMGMLVMSLILGTIVLVLSSVTIALWISSGITRTINQAVNAISTSSSEIAVTVEEHERTATQQAAAVSETTTTMDELGASSRQSAEQAETAANTAKQVLALVDGQHAQSSSASLRDKVGQIAEQILRLSEQTNQIGSISALVSDLANQTNMLALNAAVEAVRAGEHGKGFGVVAAEIRKLADQSRKSAERINSLVVDIQNATNSTVMVTDEGTKTVENIVSAINNIALSSQQISLTAKQQAIAINQVVDAMNAINQGAVQTATGISQTKIGTQKLNEAAQNLKSVV